MEAREPNEVLPSHLVKLSNRVVLEELSEGGLHEFKVQEVAREGLVVLSIDFVVPQGLVLDHVRARVEGALDLDSLREGSDGLLQLFPSYILVINDSCINFDEDSPVAKHVRRKHGHTGLFNSELEPLLICRVETHFL